MCSSAPPCTSVEGDARDVELSNCLRNGGGGGFLVRTELAEYCMVGGMETDQWGNGSVQVI